VAEAAIEDALAIFERQYICEPPEVGLPNGSPTAL
jgi:hypothetical protein